MKGKQLIDDWVDGDELRALAESLLAPPSEPMEAEEEVIFGSEFEGFADFGEPSEDEPEPGVAIGAETPKDHPVEEPQDEPAEDEAPESMVVQPDPFRKSRTKIAGAATARIPGAESTRAPGWESSGKPTAPVSVTMASARREADAPKSGKTNESLAALVRLLREQFPLQSCLIGCGEQEVLFDDTGEKRWKEVATRLALAAHRQEGESTSGSSSLVVKVAAGQVMQVIPLTGAGEGHFAALILPRPLAEGGVRAFVRALRETLAAASAARQ